MVLFSDPEEAKRARSGLLEHGVSQEDIRLYESEEILRSVLPVKIGAGKSRSCGRGLGRACAG
jgi:hypothetical protein